MGTLENLSALVEELRGSRERLESLADRTAALQARLRADVPTIVSLDKLAQERIPMPDRGRREVERFEGEEALPSDAWEISLINEEGK